MLRQFGSWVLGLAIALASCQAGGLGFPSLSLQDPGEPAAGKPSPKMIPPPAGAITLADVDQKELRAIDDELVSCGTRNSLSSWTDPKRGIGCGRDHIVARLQAISKQTGGKLEVKVDRFEATAPRTHNQPAPLENVMAILPGS